MRRDTEPLAKLMIRLAALIVWALKDGNEYQQVRDQGEVAWQHIKEGR